MPKDIGDQGRKFITTEPLIADTQAEANQVWQAIRSTFAEQNCIGYWRYPLFSKVGEIAREPDILIADQELGVIVIKVEPFTIDQIVAVDEHKWQIKNNSNSLEINPYQEVQQQLRAVVAYCDRDHSLWRKVIGTAMVALPLITEQQWQQKGFQNQENPGTVIWQNQLGESSLLEVIKNGKKTIPGKILEDNEWQALLGVMSGNSVLRQAPSIRISSENKNRSSVLEILQKNLYELDLQQEHIGKEIPPGVQRIRGIAGSGKTILLCQKAAHMHLKHPDWDIALVFFSRTLYELIISLVDRWLRRFSNGEISYDSQTNKKLRILHAWGAKNQPGFYSTICWQQGIRPKTATDTRERRPNRGLAELCKRLLEETEIEPLFDAVLIDEGQDLVTDDDLKFQEKQAIYWLAYQALRPVERENNSQRRLIWAYDEAQSLDTLKIPTTKELFGEQFSKLLSQGSQYTGGIKKSEIMRRCYRTPGSILTAAHAMGMGLLRPQGMLAGITRAKEWQAIGYEVRGKFTPGHKITLHRPPENSPNPMEKIWGEPVLEFKTYESRQAELEALSNQVLHNVIEDGLKLSREILVIILGSNSEAIELENKTANFLIEQGIKIYIPTALDLDEISPQWPNKDPDRFWLDGGLTVSRVPRAKGHEADMVYVIGLDQIARNEADISLRNQLFVALTRARGWVSLSGVGNYPMYAEMEQVIESKNTFNFVYKRPLKRDIGEDIIE